ncbi:leucine--tRNA ligase [Candidatus Woesebacteria bacterium]|nr:MAG: leucine--tRNA ligase [Candidatus Woesebacteria bacterium]
MSSNKRSTRNSFDHIACESKWWKTWLEKNIYTPDILNAKKPFYNLMMFPYPSAEGLHVGNMYAFTGADIYGRYKRMSGFDVFEPIGLDGFGIHSENYAIKVGRHPKENAQITEDKFYGQLSKVGNSYAWDMRLETYDKEYYKWTQWLFIKLFKKGLAYKGNAKVNWCPNCKTVLADEQVEDEACERCKSIVERREMSSWYFRITEYADRLLANIDTPLKDNGEKVSLSKEGKSGNGLNWPEKIKIAQRKWIGKKEGININYPIENTDKTVVCWTSRPDTNFGATFIVVSPEYAQKNLLSAVSAENQIKLSEYINTSLNKSEQQRLLDGREKTGVFTGLYAINGLNGYKMPIWVADFVLSGVGTGAVVGVPGHDKRDFEFAQAFQIPIIRVVSNSGDNSDIRKIDQVQENEGVMINSDFLNGLEIHEAKEKMMDYLEKNKMGEREYNYHLRDWLISRQRYWGPPIPMIYCAKCAAKGVGERQDLPGWYCVNETDLPVVLPDIKDFKPKGDGTSPLFNAPKSWKEVRCPKCNNIAVRELDVSDTFLDSSWYFLRYPSLKSEANDLPWDNKITEKWLPVDAYIGGAEHAVLHLLYSRFIAMALKDMKYLNFEEPFPFLFGHGLIIKDGAKMSKSKGNVINPDDYIAKFGADTLRCYLMFLGPFDSGGDFRDTGMEGMQRFLMRVWDLFSNHRDVILNTSDGEKVLVMMNKTIKRVTGDMDSFKFNTALSAIMEFVNLLRDTADNANETKASLSTNEWNSALCVLTKLIAPYAPYMSEELWVNVLGQDFSIHTSKWPMFDEKYLVEDTLDIVLQVNGKLRAMMTVDKNVANDKEKLIKLAQANDKISPYLTGVSCKKIIYVPNKLVNFVV